MWNEILLTVGWDSLIPSRNILNIFLEYINILIFKYKNIEKDLWDNDLEFKETNANLVMNIQNAIQQITHNNTQNEINVYNINDFKKDIIIKELMSGNILPGLDFKTSCSSPAQDSVPDARRTRPGHNKY